LLFDCIDASRDEQDNEDGNHSPNAQCPFRFLSALRCRQEVSSQRPDVFGFSALVVAKQVDVRRTPQPTAGSSCLLPQLRSLQRSVVYPAILAALLNPGAQRSPVIQQSLVGDFCQELCAIAAKRH
jgi:hypothetical protein